MAAPSFYFGYNYFISVATGYTSEQIGITQESGFL